MCIGTVLALILAQGLAIPTEWAFRSLLCEVEVPME